MSKSAEAGYNTDKDTYKKAAIELCEALLEMQFELRQQARFPVIILVNSTEGVGEGETAKLLNEQVDSHLVGVQSFLRSSDEELERPPQWRSWRRLPPKGRIGISFGNWYGQIFYVRVEGHIKEAKLDQVIDAARRFKRMLCDEGALLFKFWFHLSKRQLKERLKALERDPQHGWKLGPLDWKQSEVYDRFVHCGERVLCRTSRGYAPWYVMEGADERYRVLTVDRILLEGLQTALVTKERAKRQPHVALLASGLNSRSLLDSLGLGQHLDKGAHKEQLAAEQVRLVGPIRDKRFRQYPLVAVFEGNDATGRGGTVRRVTDVLGLRQYHVVPIAVPTEEERVQSYLWRFWRHIPARYQFITFDCSWYDHVLVECTEGLCAPADRLCAYDEINDFEEQLSEYGIIVVKFWLAIDKQTQMERFKEHEKVPYKRYKITEEDWHNHNKWGQYVDTVDDMVDRTNAEITPRTLVEANGKRFTRIKVLRTINDTIEAAYKKGK